MKQGNKGYYVRHNVDMTSLNTMRLCFTAQNLVYPYSEEGVLQVFQDFDGCRIVPIGAGSNSIFMSLHYGDEVVF